VGQGEFRSKGENMESKKRSHTSVCQKKVDLNQRCIIMDVHMKRKVSIGGHKRKKKQGKQLTKGGELREKEPRHSSEKLASLYAASNKLILIVAESTRDTGGVLTYLSQSSKERNKDCKKKLLIMLGLSSGGIKNGASYAQLSMERKSPD